MIVNTLYDTRPFILHYPSSEDYNDKWELVKSMILYKRNKNIQPLEELDIITWNNSNEESILEKSLSVLGIKCEVLGKNIENWSNRFKIKLTCDYLESSTKPYVLGVDAFDAIFVDYPKNMNNDMIFNATPNSFPFKKEFDRYEESITNSNIFCHLNAGVWFGKREMCLNFFKDALSYEDSFTKRYLNSEQVVLRSILPRHKYVEIDSTCQYFQVLNKFENINQYVKIDSKFFN